MRLGANLGFAAVSNRGIARAEGCDWIGLLNPDAFPEPGWLAAGPPGTAALSGALRTEAARGGGA